MLESPAQQLIDLEGGSIERWTVETELAATEGELTVRARRVGEVGGAVEAAAPEPGSEFINEGAMVGGGDGN